MAEKLKSKLNFSITGRFITERSRELLFEQHSLTKAMETLTNALVTDELSKEHTAGIALGILNGDYEICGTYPGDDYGVVKTDQFGKATRLKDYEVRLAKKLAGMEEELDEATHKLQLLCEYVNENVSWFDWSEIERRYKDEYDKPFFEQYASDRSWLEQLPVYQTETGESPDDSDSGADVSCKTPTTPQGQLNDLLARLRSNENDDYGWLFPDGTFHPVEFGGHSSWALNYLKDHLTDFKERYWAGEFKHPTDDLEMIYGAVLLHSPHGGIARVSRTEEVNVLKPLTKAQREFLYEYYTKRNLPDMVEYVRNL